MKRINETKRERFVRVVKSRTNKTISMIKLIGNCSNRASYDYTNSDVEKIFSSIEQELKNAKQKFISKNEKENRFTLNQN